MTLSNTKLIREVAVTRRHYDMGCAYMIGDAGRAMMIAAYQRLESALATKETENLNQEMARFESFHCIAEYRRAKMAREVATREHIAVAAQAWRC
jgi:hypothetical protein